MIYCENVIDIAFRNCKVVGLVCNVELLPIAKGVGTGQTRTHLGPACAQTTPRLPSFGYMPMASRAAIKKLWRADIIQIIQENTITTFSYNK